MKKKTLLLLIFAGIILAGGLNVNSAQAGFWSNVGNFISDSLLPGSGIVNQAVINNSDYIKRSIGSTSNYLKDLGTSIFNNRDEVVGSLLAGYSVVSGDIMSASTSAIIGKVSDCIVEENGDVILEGVTIGIISSDSNSGNSTSYKPTVNITKPTNNYSYKVGESIDFMATYDCSDGGCDNFQWLKNCNNPTNSDILSASSNMSQTYNTAGSQIVYFRVKDEGVWSDCESVSFTISDSTPTCTASYNKSIINSGEQATLTWSSTGDVDGILEYSCTNFGSQSGNIITYDGSYRTGTVSSSGSGTATWINTSESVKNEVCTFKAKNSDDKEASCTATLKVNSSSTTSPEPTPTTTPVISLSLGSNASVMVAQEITLKYNITSGCSVSDDCVCNIIVSGMESATLPAMYQNYSGAYVMRITPSLAGQYNFTFKCENSLGGIGTSSSVSVTVEENPNTATNPVAIIISPQDGANVAVGETVTFVGSGAGAGGEYKWCNGTRCGCGSPLLRDFSSSNIYTRTFNESAGSWNGTALQVKNSAGIISTNTDFVEVNIGGSGSGTGGMLNPTCDAHYNVDSINLGGTATLHWSTNADTMSYNCTNYACSGSTCTYDINGRSKEIKETTDGHGIIGSGTATWTGGDGADETCTFIATNSDGSSNVCRDTLIIGDYDSNSGSGNEIPYHDDGDLPAPTNLTGSCVGGYISGNWSAVSGANEYNVIIKKTDQGICYPQEANEDISNTNYGKTLGDDSNASYYYVVKAIDSSGAVGEDTTLIVDCSNNTVVNPDDYPDDNDLIVTCNNNTISASWPAVPGADKYRVMIYEKKANDAGYTVITEDQYTTGTTYQMSVAGEEGTVYDYAVEAQKENGDFVHILLSPELISCSSGTTPTPTLTPTPNGTLLTCGGDKTEEDCQALGGTVADAGGCTVCKIDYAESEDDGCPSGMMQYESWGVYNSSNCEGCETDSGWRNGVDSCISTKTYTGDYEYYSVSEGGCNCPSGSTVKQCHEEVCLPGTWFLACYNPNAHGTTTITCYSQRTYIVGCIGAVKPTCSAKYDADSIALGGNITTLRWNTNADEMKFDCTNYDCSCGETLPCTCTYNGIGRSDSALPNNTGTAIWVNYNLAVGTDPADETCTFTATDSVTELSSTCSDTLIIGKDDNAGNNGDDDSDKLPMADIETDKVETDNIVSGVGYMSGICTNGEHIALAQWYDYNPCEGGSGNILTTSDFNGDPITLEQSLDGIVSGSEIFFRTKDNNGNWSNCASYLYVNKEISNLCGIAGSFDPTQSEATYGSYADSFRGKFCVNGEPFKTPEFPKMGKSVSWICKSADGIQSQKCYAQKNSTD